MEQSKMERFLASPQFQRLFEVMATYQRLLEENKDDPEKYNLIKKRFKDKFDSAPQEGAEQTPQQDENILFKKQLLHLVETGKLTKEKFAGLFARSTLAEGILESYHPKPGSITETGKKFINEVVAYDNKEDNDWININIIPTSVRGTADLLSKIKEGFQEIAQELKNGSLQHIKEVQMHSWLLGPDFADKIAVIFGENVKIADYSEDSASVREIQSLALSYNKRAAEKYLLTGELPEVKELKMTSEDFIKRFGAGS